MFPAAIEIQSIHVLSIIIYISISNNVLLICTEISRELVVRHDGRPII